MIDWSARLLLFALSVAQQDCASLDAAGRSEGIFVPGHIATRKVVGHGRAQFYSAPSNACVIQGVYIIPRDTVTAYIDYNGYTAVLFINPKSDDEVVGWVLASRLRDTGKGVSPE